MNKMVHETSNIGLTNLGSSANNPRLNWSQLQETISLLCLAMAQIESSRSDSAKSIDGLMRSFVRITEESAALKDTCQYLANSDDQSDKKHELTQRADVITEEVCKAIVAVQYHDRLSQKLEHVTTSLNHLGELINDRSRIFNPDEWVKIQREIRGHYTLDCERLMFDLIMNGASLKQALQRYHDDYDQMYPQDNLQEQAIEFF